VDRPSPGEIGSDQHHDADVTSPTPPLNLRASWPSPAGRDNDAKPRQAGTMSFASTFHNSEIVFTGHEPLCSVWSPAASASAGPARPITGLPDPFLCCPGQPARQDWSCSLRLTDPYGLSDNEAPEESSVMVQPDRQDPQPAAPRVVPPSRPAVGNALSAARVRFEGSLAGSFIRQLRAFDFANQAMLFGAGLLVSLLPFVILFPGWRYLDPRTAATSLGDRAISAPDRLAPKRAGPWSAAHGS
jgi:hypothetical protein